MEIEEQSSEMNGLKLKLFLLEFINNGADVAETTPWSGELPGKTISPAGHGCSRHAEVADVLGQRLQQGKCPFAVLRNYESEI